MSDPIYDIKAAWAPKAEEPGDLGRRFILTLDQLERIDPVFGDWGLGAA